MVAEVGSVRHVMCVLLALGDTRMQHGEQTPLSDVLFDVPQGEPLVVQLGWAALCASFSASLAFVVWGRSGL
jgi:hypothetical protein